MQLERTIIGMVHLPPLPGSPRWDGSMARVVAAALADAGALVEGGVDAVLVENFNDMPFTPGRVEPATVAAMSVVAAEIRRAQPRTLLGVNVLKNDARAALAVAAAVGAEFIRVNVHAGAVLADQGIVQSDAYGTLRDRRLLGVEVAISCTAGWPTRSSSRARRPARRLPSPTSSACGAPSPTFRSWSAAGSPPRRSRSSCRWPTASSSAPRSSATAMSGCRSSAPALRSSLRRLTTASLLGVLLAA